MLGEEHGHAVGLLAGGAGRAPDAQAAQVAAGFDQLGQQFSAQQFEGAAIAEEAGLVDGHGFGDGAFEDRILFDFEAVDELFQLGHALVAQDFCQAGVEEVIARGVKHVLREPEDELAKIAVVNAGGSLHD